MSDHDVPRYRYWGERKPVMLARPAETVQMASGTQKSARIRLYGPIDSWGAPYGVAASEVAAALDEAGTSTAVEMHMHSPGGDAFEGLAIMNLLRQHPGGVDIVVDGLAASAASIVAMGARSVTMVPGSQLMIHDASALAIGRADDMREAADMLDSISGNAADQYAAKTGKSAEQMRAAMKATTWYKAQEAVDAGLADAVLAVDDEQAKAAATAAAALQFDLSIYPNAPAMQATQTPAEPPVTPPTENEEADTMSDTLSKGLRERLGVADDADEATILAALDEALTEHADEPPTAPVDLTAATAALEAAGKTVLSATLLEEIKAQAAEGRAARLKQLADERDEAVQAAVTLGKVSRDRAEHWRAAWDKDPEGTKADLASLEARFPVKPPTGFAGADDTLGESAQPITDDEAGALAQLAGISKEGLLR